MELLYRTGVPLGSVHCISWSRMNLIALSVSTQIEGFVAKNFDGYESVYHTITSRERACNSQYALHRLKIEPNCVCAIVPHSFSAHAIIFLFLVTVSISPSGSCMPSRHRSGSIRPWYHISMIVQKTTCFKLLTFFRAVTHQLLVFDPNRPWEFHTCVLSSVYYKSTII